VKTLVAVAVAIALAAAGFFVWGPSFASRPKAAPAEIATPEPQGGPQALPIPETMITLRHALQWKNADGAPEVVLEAGAQLVSESTQGLDYIVSHKGRSFRVRCDDAYESHGRFTDGRVEQLALQMAAEIRAAGKVPTNERIVSRAQEALEQRRLNASDADPASLVDSLQRVLLFNPNPDLDVEPPSPASKKPD
jgi:hypothetical protein